MITNAKDYLMNLMDKSKEDVTDMNNPLCLNCNECCSILTILSVKEHESLCEYFETEEGKKILKIARNKIKKHWRRSTIYMLCPFTDDNTKKCMIYDKRPTICKMYHCNKSNYKEYLIFKDHYMKELDRESKNDYAILNFFEDLFLKQ